MSVEKMYSEFFPFWASLPQEDKDLICSNTKKSVYRKGQTIHNGNECTGGIIVKSGCVRVYILSEEGKEVTLYRLYSGDMCMLAASCVLQSITFDVTVDAEEYTECYNISSSVMNEISSRNKDMKIYMLETALSRFSAVMWSMEQILFMSFDKRLAIFLLDEIAKNGGDCIDLTHEQIAKYMGSAREVVSRMLKYFSNEGIVELYRGGVKIKDKAKLKKIAL